MKLFTAIAAIVIGASSGAHRSSSAKHEFQRLHPCPSTGRTSGACPGFIVDHIDPLCHGGADAPANMQWQTYDDAHAKDRWERQICRHH